MRELVIDVSKWDGDVDFESWRERRGLWGVIVKAGGSDVGRYEDYLFEQHYAAAKQAGLHVGAYYYSAATDISFATGDAQHFVSLLGDKSFDLPCYMDVEESSQLDMDAGDLSQVMTAFCDVVSSAGRIAGVYAGYDVFSDASLPDGTARWVAAWRDDWPAWAADYGMWQQGCMRLSDGDVAYGDVSGYTDCDWCQVDYPSLNGTSSQQTYSVTPIQSTISVPERIAQCAEHIASHDEHGYSQPNRLGDGTTETVTFSDGTFAIIHGGDYDCSSMAQMCANAAISGKIDDPITYMWTGSQYEEMTAAGFECLSFDYDDTRRGDVLWISGHTGVALGDGMQADARGDEYGGISGPIQGDQTGGEIEIRALQTYWDLTFRYAGAETTLERATGTASSVQTGDEMICIIRPNGEGYLAYFDGQRMHPLGHPDELEAINKVYKATHGGADIPQFELGSKEAPWATRLANALSRTDPMQGDESACLLKLDGTNTVAYYDGSQLHPLANQDEAKAIRTAYRIMHGTEIRETDFGSKDKPMGKHLASALRRTA